VAIAGVDTQSRLADAHERRSGEHCILVGDDAMKSEHSAPQRELHAGIRYGQPVAQLSTTGGAPVLVFSNEAM
jgi:hypothetical protein